MKTGKGERLDVDKFVYLRNLIKDKREEESKMSFRQVESKIFQFETVFSL